VTAAPGGVALRVRRGDTSLVVIDVQERLASAMPPPVFDELTRNALRMLAAAARFKLPVAVSEQYPAGLGRTVPVIGEAVAKLSPPALYLDKTAFSLSEEPLFQRFLGAGPRTLVAIGMETHVCVFQTVRALCERGFSVHVPVDAVASRTETNRRVGLDLCERAGAVLTSTETVIFDLLERAGTDDFKALSKLLK
jgi:nicotinamidase-related amidase